MSHEMHNTSTPPNIYAPLGGRWQVRSKACTFFGKRPSKRPAAGGVAKSKSEKFKAAGALRRNHPKQVAHVDPTVHGGIC